jgi:nitrogen regulatory protein P-II 1
MKLVTAILRPEKLIPVQTALGEVGITQATFTEAWGTGNERAQIMLYRGKTRDVRLPRIRIEIVVEDECVDSVVNAIQRHGKTEQVGDGIILVQPLDSFVRVRTGVRRTGVERRAEPAANVPTNRLQTMNALATLR